MEWMPPKVPGGLGTPPALTKLGPRVANDPGWTRQLTHGIRRLSDAYLWPHLTTTAMNRIITTLLLAIPFTGLSAQQIQDTPEMKAKAAERMELVNKTVTLTEEQKPQVEEVYLQVERYLVMAEQRFASAGITGEQKEADMKNQYENMDRMVEQKLITILTTEQQQKWVEASK